VCVKKNTKSLAGSGKVQGSFLIRIMSPCFS
jgi:hypothetical protein